MASFFDDFTGTNGALLRLRAGWSFSGPVAYQDRATIQNNRVKCGGVGGGGTHYAFLREVSDTQQFIEAKFLRTTGVACNLYARWVSDSNFIGVRNNGTSIDLIKRVAGIQSTVVNIATGLVTGDLIRLELRGSNAKLFKNGAQIGAGGGYTIADSVLQSATRVGLGGEGASGSVEVFDDIAGGGLTVTLAPADGAHASRGGAGALTFVARAGLVPADGRSDSGSGAGGVSLRLLVSAASGRSAISGTALLLPSIGPPGLGEVTRIGADGAASVPGESNLVRVGAD